MSPHDMTPHRDAFNAACKQLGWRVRRVGVVDGFGSSSLVLWINQAGERLFYESELTEAMVREIIRLGTVVSEPKS